jgi:DNA end-binding protein Ku
VQFSLRQKSRLGALRVRGDVLVLQSMLWGDEVRTATFPSLEETVKISAKEKQMSAALVDSFSEDFAPEKFTDEYQQELRTLIEAKLDKGDVLNTDETFGREEEGGEEGGRVLDLMEALRRSVEKNRTDKTGADKTGAGKSKPSKSEDREPARKSRSKKGA